MPNKIQESLLLGGGGRKSFLGSGDWGTYWWGIKKGDLQSTACPVGTKGRKLPSGVASSPYEEGGTQKKDRELKV